MKRFQKNKEDFVCENCNTFVSGDGYTNHCPQCLISKHVDRHPGDRAAHCGGRMDVIAIETRGSEYEIVHECVQCGHQKNNKVSPKDSFNALISLAKKLSPQQKSS